MITFRRITGRVGSFMVYRDDTLAGSVRKVERWTVRGTATVWEAWRKGRYVGGGKTRKAAAEILAALS